MNDLIPTISGSAPAGPGSSVETPTGEDAVQFALVAASVDTAADTSVDASIDGDTEDDTQPVSDESIADPGPETRSMPDREIDLGLAMTAMLSPERADGRGQPQLESSPSTAPIASATVDTSHELHPAVAPAPVDLDHVVTEDSEQAAPGLLSQPTAAIEADQSFAIAPGTDPIDGIDPSIGDKATTIVADLGEPTGEASTGHPGSRVVSSVPAPPTGDQSDGRAPLMTTNNPVMTINNKEITDAAPSAQHPSLVAPPSAEVVDEPQRSLTSAPADIDEAGVTPTATEDLPTVTSDGTDAETSTGTPDTQAPHAEVAPPAAATRPATPVDPGGLSAMSAADPIAAPSDPTVAATQDAETVRATIVRQTAEALRSVRSLPNGSHRITVTLQPEELGHVQLEIVLEDGVLHVRAVAAEDITRASLESGLDSLRSELEQAGINAGSLDVDSQQAGHDGAEEPVTPDVHPSSGPTADVEADADDPIRPSPVGSGSRLVDMRL